MHFKMEKNNSKEFFFQVERNDTKRNETQRK